MNTSLMNAQKYTTLSDQDKLKIFTICWEHCRDLSWFQKEILDPYFTVPTVPTVTTSNSDEFWDDLDDMPSIPISNYVQSISVLAEPSPVISTVHIDAQSIDKIITQVSLRQDAFKSEVNARLDLLNQSMAKRKENATVKGDHAETVIADILSDRWEYERTSHLPHHADFSVYLKIGRRYRVLIDIKNYSSVIPSTEYDKFLRDIHSTKADAGIYFAFAGTITGRTRTISLDVSSSEPTGNPGVPIAIVQNSPPETMHLALDLIRTHFLIHSQSLTIDMDNIQYYIDQSLDQINQLYVVKSHIIKCTAQINEQLSQAQIDLSECITKLQIYLSQISGRLHTDLIGTEWLTTSAENIPQIIDDALPALGPRVRKEVISILVSICLKLEKDKEDFKIQQQGAKLQVCGNMIHLGSRKQVITIPVTDTHALIEIMKSNPGSTYDGECITWELRKKYISAILSCM